MFIFKFVAPYVNSLQHIKANHNIALFVMSKRAYLDMKKLKNDIQQKKKLPNAKYFEEFTLTQTYRNLLDQIIGDT